MQHGENRYIGFFVRLLLLSLIKERILIRFTLEYLFKLVCLFFFIELGEHQFSSSFSIRKLHLFFTMHEEFAFLISFIVINRYIHMFFSSPLPWSFRIDSQGNMEQTENVSHSHGPHPLIDQVLVGGRGFDAEYMADIDQPDL